MGRHCLLLTNKLSPFKQGWLQLGGSLPRGHSNRPSVKELYPACVWLRAGGLGGLLEKRPGCDGACWKIEAPALKMNHQTRPCDENPLWYPKDKNIPYSSAQSPGSDQCECMCAQSCLCVAPWTEARQAPLSMGFSRQEYWSGLPCPFPGDLPHPGIEPVSLASHALAHVFFTTSTTWEAPVQCQG